MKLILARHGNTFAPGDKVVWAGTSNDLPLVASGLKQAEDLAAALVETRLIPDFVFSGSLQRAKKYAEIVCDSLKLKTRPQIDPRLQEIDYGSWTGLSNQEVMQQYSRGVLEAWDSHSLWPTAAGWGGSEEEAVMQARTFFRELLAKYHDQTVLAVSSNGKLRYFLKLITGEFEKRSVTGTFKVKTGNLCLIEADDEQAEVLFWDLTPEEFKNQYSAN